MSDFEVFWESEKPQYIVQTAENSAHDLSMYWCDYSYHTSLETAKETAQDLTSTYTDVRIIKYGKD